VNPRRGECHFPNPGNCLSYLDFAWNQGGNAVRLTILMVFAALILVPATGVTAANASPQLSAAQAQPTDITSAKKKKKKKAAPGENMKSAPSELPKGAYN
jgi:hypothetical protein